MINLTGDIVLTADKHQYVVGRARERTDNGHKGEIEIISPRYYTKLPTALEGAVTVALRQGIEDGTITTLRGIVAEQKRLQLHFEEQLKALA